MTFRAAIVGLVLLTALDGYGEGPPEMLELSRISAIALAISKNLDLQTEALDSEMAEVEAARSWSIYDPRFSTSASYGVLATPGDPFFRTKSGNASIGLTQYLPTGGSITISPQSGYTTAEFDSIAGESTTDWQSSIGVSISQPVLRNAGKETMELNITLAESALEDSLERFRSFTTDTVYSVIASYNRLYTQRQILDTRFKSLNSAQKLLDELRQREKPGPTQDVDVANAEYALTLRRSDLVEAQRNVGDEEARLRFLIGMETNTPIVPIDPPGRYEPPETEDQALQDALKHRSDLKQMRSTLQTSELQERVARRQALPELYLTASGGLTGTGDEFEEANRQLGDDPGTFWSAGMRLSFPLGNTALKNSYLRSKIRTEKVRSQLRALEWRIRDEIKSDMRALIAARLQVQATDKALQIAVQRLGEYRKNSRVGRATVQDVLNAENDLTTARNASTRAVESFAFGVTKLWRDTGRLLERQHVHIDTGQAKTLTQGTVTPPPPDAAEKRIRIAPVPSVEPRQTEPEAYSLFVGEYMVKSALSEAEIKVRRAGLSPDVKEGPKKTKQMVRLFGGEFSTLGEARKMLEKLRKAKADAFILKNADGRYSVYAGSYLYEKGAVREQKRLGTRGMKLSLRRAEVPMESWSLNAGVFPTREAAGKEAEKLVRQGLKPTVIEKRQ